MFVLKLIAIDFVYLIILVFIQGRRYLYATYTQRPAQQEGAELEGCQKLFFKETAR